MKLVPVGLLALAGCSSTSKHAMTHEHQHGGAHASHHSFSDAHEWTRVFDDPSRDAWQRPDDVLLAMALDPTMTVADVGAGTGYFAVRLARAVPQGRVIATDIEPDMVRFVTERARREQLDNLTATVVGAAEPGLAAQSVDRILIVHVWHHLAGRGAYARSLAAALRRGGRVFVVDFTLTAERGPPPSLRVAPEQVVAELTTAGFSARVVPISLPDQYVVEARLP